MPRRSADNDDRAIVVATSRWRSAGSRRRRHPMRAKDPLCARYRDPDPSRIALWHGNGDFGRHAWRDHAELPDSVAELPFGGRAGLLARRFRRSRSDLDHTAYRRGPESGSEHTETSCNTLHRQSETHQPPNRRRLQPPSAPIRSSMPPCSKLSRRGLETSECASLAERRPTLTASARAGVRNLRSGRKKACGAVKQKKDDEVKSSLVDALSHQKPCRQKSADFDRRSQTLGNMRANGVRSLLASCHKCHHEIIIEADQWLD